MQRGCGARGDVGYEGSREPPALLVSGVSWGRSLPRPLSVSAVRIKRESTCKALTSGLEQASNRPAGLAVMTPQGLF